ncbi:glutathione S-transferase N-terminal domain-containing protein [Lysobacter enzymogenes]|uniref:glutathione S-transferase N-terminal domain-containing protein n=1 Tax=Lysobacter enzymogenes TaxID=69 RepID=UPI00099B4FAD|nr:glutathione S-transferase N-terminal domain-containing protein [Lysobacter enzymogenes]QQQ00053.1 glutathione S-transferase N-terminal domain-containing protein [Lysobacter enzymogenes]UZW59502.1 glutathione S-transferase N-terminal domain-containing protein [Lysobacter enzymogenes]
MKLYSKPGACSTADHIALQWTGGAFEVEILDKDTMKAPAYLAINPAGAVPAVVDGEFVLTQNAAIMGYIADTFPQAQLAGDGSAQQRAEAARWLAFCNSDIHPAFVPIFAPGAFHPDPAQADVVRQTARERLRKMYAAADRRLADREWLAGFRSYADPYLYITLRWADAVKVDLSGYAHLAAFKQRMQDDAGVQAALKAEGLA